MTILALYCFVFLFCDIVINKCGMAVFWPLGYSILKIMIALFVCIGAVKAGGTIKKRIDYGGFNRTDETGSPGLAGSCETSRGQ